jgi:hypothetical protein
VTVAPATQEGQVLVAWQAVGDGSAEIEYQVRPVTTGMQPKNTTDLFITFEVPPGTDACFTVVAITTVGRISPESNIACL